MEEIYVPLDTAAKLESIKYNTFVQRMQRNIDLFKTKTQSKTNGGRDTVLVALSSLSDAAKKVYSEQMKINKVQLNKMENVSTNIPWYVETDLDWYIEKYRESYYKAVEIGNAIRKFLSYSEKNRTEFAQEFAKEYLNKSQRTLYRYTETYLEASVWSDKLKHEDGGDYDFLKVLSLGRKPKETGRFPSFTEEVKQVIKNIWFNESFAQNNSTKEMLYDKLKQVAEVNEWNRIPSYQSVARYISYLLEDEVMYNAWIMAKKGNREYKNKVMVKGSRDTKGLKVMQILMGDEHTFDCWVAYKNSNGTISPIRPKLVAWIDVRSRMILGDVLCKDANSDILKQSLFKLIYHDAKSVPEYIYIDNGKDYTAETMTGLNRKNRRKIKAERKNNIDFDDVTKGFYKSIGIVDDHEALPYQPWSKSEIERFFRTVCNRFTKWFTSYTGTLTGAQTSDKVNKDIQKLFKDGKLLTIEEFYEKWHYWVNNVYAMKQHSTLKKIGESWTTPKSLFEKGERYDKAAPPIALATMLMMQSDNVRVYNTGINKFGFEYRSDVLCDYINKTVDIKYDPQDISVIYIFKNGKRIGEAYSQELLQIESEVSERTLEHLKMQKRQEKRDKKRLEEARIPFEELNEQFVGFNSVIGGINLMIEGKGKSKVVALPSDSTYLQNKDIRTSVQSKESKKCQNKEEDNEFFSRKAQAALSKLRQLG